MIRRLFLPTAAVALALAATATEPASTWWTHVRTLAAARFDGRETAGPGHREAAAYVAAQFEKAGLKPAGTGGYLQPVPLVTRRIVESGSTLALVNSGNAQPVQLGREAIISMRVDPAPTVDAPLVFAGYGLTVPEAKYDDLAGLDLRGAIVVMLAGGPGEIAGTLKSHYQSGARTQFLLRTGAIGTLTIPNPRQMDLPWDRIAANRTATAMTLADTTLDDARDLRFSAVWNPAYASRLFSGTGHTFDEILALAAAGKPLPRFPLNRSLRAAIKVERGRTESQNVVAVLPGADAALRDEFVVLSAHLDHLGKGHPGAMDNASGIATLLEAARLLRENRVAPRRSVLFAAVTGEEKGLLGSRWFANHPTVKPGSMVANLNVDMFLPIYPMRSVIAYGLNESDLKTDLEKMAGALGIRVLDDPEPARNSFIRSDQYSFVRRGIPALAFKLGYDKGSAEETAFKNWLKERYHAPADDLNQPVNFEAAARFNEFFARLALSVANRESRPAWNGGSFFRRFARPEPVTALPTVP